MRLQTIVALTTETGETIPVVRERHPARSYGKQFIILFTEAMVETATKLRSLVTSKLLMLLPDYLNYTDFKQLHTVSIAERLETGSGNISRALAELLELGIVEREGKGPRTSWRLSSDWGWNGTADQYHAFRAGRMKGKRPPKGAAESRRMHIMETGNSPY